MNCGDGNIIKHCLIHNMTPKYSVSNNSYGMGAWWIFEFHIDTLSSSTIRNIHNRQYNTSAKVRTTAIWDSTFLHTKHNSVKNKDWTKWESTSGPTTNEGPVQGLHSDNTHRAVYTMFDTTEHTGHRDNRKTRSSGKNQSLTFLYTTRATLKTTLTTVLLLLCVYSLPR
jgi:hypothetical protein